MSRLEDLANVASMGYIFGGLLGKGCYGKVYKAQYYNPEISLEIADLACKYIIKKKCPHDFLTKFLPREIEILKKISHPNIIKVHSIIQTSSTIFIFMKLETEDLLTYIKSRGVVKENVAKIWFYQLASAVNYLHSLNIAHRDLKCENILISKNLNLKIADFGFARYCCTVDNFFQDTTIRVLSETYCGSAAYAPPEVVSGTPYDIMKVDVWSLGIILSIILNGRMPFDDSRISKLISDQKKRLYTTNPEVMNEISYECKVVMFNCLEPNPKIRWSSSDLLKTPWLRSQVEKYRNK